MHDRLTPKITTAMEIAALSRLIPMEDAAELIQQYANTVAAGAKLTATDEAYARIDALMQSCMSRLPGKDEYAEVMAKVAEGMADA